MKSPQIHRGEMTQELGRESPAHCTGGSSGTRPILDKLCAKRNRPMEFLSRKKPKMGKEKNVMLSPLKAEVWGAYNFKCKNTGEPPQNFRGKRQGFS